MKRLIENIILLYELNCIFIKIQGPKTKLRLLKITGTKDISIIRNGENIKRSFKKINYFYIILICFFKKIF